MSRLPQSVIDKIASISTQADEHAVLASRTVQKINELNKASSVIDDPDELRRALHEATRLRSVQSDHQKRSKELTEVVTSLNTWVRSLSATTALELVAAPAIDLEKGETPQDGLVRIRGVIAGLQNERRRVSRARQPLNDLKKRIERYVAERAERGAPHISLANGLEIDFAAGNFEGGTTRRLVDVMCWLQPDQMRAKLETEVKALRDEGGLVLTSAERAKKLAELDAAVLKFERAEEAIVIQLLESGHAVSRRPFASPMAILGVKVVTEKPKKSRAA